MKVTKRQLRRIIQEEISRMRLLSEAEGQPSKKDVEALIKKKEENLRSLEGMRMMDPSIDDAIAAEEAAIGKLQGLLKKMG